MALSSFQPQIRSSPQRVFISAHYGDPAGTRTPDLRLKRALLYQLSYWVISTCTKESNAERREIEAAQPQAQAAEPIPRDPRKAAPQALWGSEEISRPAQLSAALQAGSGAVRGISELAGMAGLEPANAGVKVPCLTTWLHPNVDVRQGPERTLRPSAMVWGG